MTTPVIVQTAAMNQVDFILLSPIRIVLLTRPSQALVLAPIRSSIVGIKGISVHLFQVHELMMVYAVCILCATM